MLLDVSLCVLAASSIRFSLDTRPSARRCVDSVAVYAVEEQAERVFLLSVRKSVTQFDAQAVLPFLEIHAVGDHLHGYVAERRGYVEGVVTAFAEHDGIALFAFAGDGYDAVAHSDDERAVVASVADVPAVAHAQHAAARNEDGFFIRPLFDPYGYLSFHTSYNYTPPAPFCQDKNVQEPTRCA